MEDPHVGYARVGKAGDEPPPERGVVDVAVLDMNHGWANLGHASIVEKLLRIAADERARTGGAAPGVRVLSYDVRRGCAVPSSASRFALVVGTGGPGSLDPRENDGVSPHSQGIREDPSWEPLLWRLFDGVLASPSTAFLGVCHSFGLLARWAGFGRAVLRPPAKGKSAGVVTNVLTEAARTHPWFAGLYRASAGGRIQVLDSRLYDVLPTGRGEGVVLANEAAPAGERGEAATMAELARFPDGRPRVWAVNHHPEIGDRGEQRARLLRIAASREVSEEWLAERLAALDAWNESDAAERRLQVTSSYTFEAPLRRALAVALASRGGAGEGP